MIWALPDWVAEVVPKPIRIASRQDPSEVRAGSDRNMATHQYLSPFVDRQAHKVLSWLPALIRPPNLIVQPGLLSAGLPKEETFQSRKTIRLSPKIRESIDHAPGPSITRLTKIAISRIGTPDTPARVQTTQSSRIAPIEAAIGVQRPTSSRMPHTIAAAAARREVDSSPATIAEAPQTIRDRPAESRRSSSPAPGQPAGKVEKSLCKRTSTKDQS